MTVPIVIGAFVLSAALSGLSVWMSIRLSHRWGVFDYPDMERKHQESPIPKLGGVAVAGTLLVATVLILPGVGQSSLPALGVLLPALGAAVLGFFDDRKHIDPYLRLFVQILLAIVAVLAGTSVNISGNVAVDLILTIAWILVIVNGVNLIDNSDGLAGMTVLVAAVASAVVAAINGQQLVLIMALVLAGSTFGFLWHNWHPARVYLGDSGAYFLGFLLAILVVRLSPSSVPQWQGAAIAVLICLLPIVDVLFVVTRRLRKGVHPFQAGRDHLSHNIQGLGVSVPKSVMALQLVSIVGGLAAIAISLGG